MNWSEAIEKYGEYEASRRKETKNQITSRIEYLLNQIPELKKKKIKEVQKK